MELETYLFESFSNIVLTMSRSFLVELSYKLFVNSILLASGIPVCSKFYAYDVPQWIGGANGKFFVNFPTALTSWIIKVQFASEVLSLYAFIGANSTCSGSVCTFRNAPYNGAQPAGASLTLGFQVYMVIFYKCECVGK